MTNKPFWLTKIAHRISIGTRLKGLIATQTSRKILLLVPAMQVHLIVGSARLLTQSPAKARGNNYKSLQKLGFMGLSFIVTNFSCSCDYLSQILGRDHQDLVYSSELPVADPPFLPASLAFSLPGSKDPPDAFPPFEAISCYQDNSAVFSNDSPSKNVERINRYRL